MCGLSSIRRGFHNLVIRKSLSAHLLNPHHHVQEGILILNEWNFALPLCQCQFLRCCYNGIEQISKSAMYGTGTARESESWISAGATRSTLSNSGRQTAADRPWWQGCCADADRSCPGWFVGTWDLAHFSALCMYTANHHNLTSYYL